MIDARRTPPRATDRGVGREHPGSDHAVGAPAPGAPTPAPVMVVLVTFNSERHLSDLARALADSSVSAQRLLVVDNASSDRSVRLARAEGFGSSRTLAMTDSVRAATRDCAPPIPNTCCSATRMCARRNAVELLLHSLQRNPRAAIAGPSLGEHADVRRFSRLGDSLASFLPERLHLRLRGDASSSALAQGGEDLVVDYVEGASSSAAPPRCARWAGSTSASSSTTRRRTSAAVWVRGDGRICSCPLPAPPTATAPPARASPTGR